MNQLLDPDISLRKDTHLYNLSSRSDISFTSVTTFVDQFFERFDAQKIANKLVNSHPKYLGRTAESLLEDWETARQHGTNVHQEIEDWIKNDIQPIEDQSIAGVRWIRDYKNINNIELLSEVIVYSLELGIAGTLDLLVLNKSTNQYEIVDWKTSKKINKKSFNKKVGIKPATRYIMDCNYYHYALQLSLYRYILEEYYDLKIQNQIIIQLKGNRVNKYELPYMRDSIIEMIGT